MPHEPGLGTRDLLDLGLPNPAERELPPTEQETRVQQRGNRFTTAGYTTYAAAIIGAMGFAMATDGPSLGNLIAACYGLLALVAATSLGTILIAIGAGERQQRPQRAAIRLALANQQRILTAQDRMAEALDRIAEHMPDVLDTRHWQGFNSAVRQGLAEPTGTDGHGQRPPRLGLVPPHEAGNSQ